MASNQNGSAGVIGVRGGRLRGEERDGVWAFLGIPYGASPSGELRWRPPQHPLAWSGVRDAALFGPIAPQPPPVPGQALPGDPDEQSEDLLTLNLWTGGLDDRRRPVMVWFHGGSFLTGTGASQLFQGDRLARRHGVVVVTCNYRLGALGFLADPSLADSGANGHSGWGNWGMADQVAVLRWVRDHAADFGGDPQNVTIFGESAGGMSVAVLLGMPSARGLFHRAVIQSGPPYVHWPDEAAQSAQLLADVLGLSELSRDALTAVPVADLLAAQAHLMETTGDDDLPADLRMPFRPTVDGGLLPLHPAAAVAAGAGAGVPLLIGSNRDEASFFSIWNPRLRNLDEDRLLRWMHDTLPVGDAPAVLDAYRAARKARGEGISPMDLWVAVTTDWVFRWPSLRFAAAHRESETRTFSYLFTWATPALGGILGACHGLEVPFLFGTVDDPAVAALTGGGAEAGLLSDAMGEAWAAFARTGDPSCPGVGEWPAWDPEGQATMELGTERRVLSGPRSEEIAVWEAVADEPVGWSTGPS